jgi:hypothetical protein
MKKKARFHHYSKPYAFIGKVPKKYIEVVRIFLRRLSEGIPGIGLFGTSGVRSLDGGPISFDLRLPVLRMEHNEKAQKLIREASEACCIPWLEEALLKTEPEYTNFIFSPDGELWGVIW